MLTHEDLQAIGRIVDERLDAKLDAKLDEKLDTKIPAMIKAGIDDLETRIDVKFDAVHERLTTIENTMLTKHDLEHSLLNFETRLTERYDHRYARRA